MISIAIDFDGTLCEDCFPEIGTPKTAVINLVKRLKQLGVKTILWTCRKDDKNRLYVAEAVEWCRQQGLIFDAVNENLPEIQERWGGDTRKVWVDYYLDDKALGCSVEFDLRQLVEYLEIKQKAGV